MADSTKYLGVAAFFGVTTTIASGSNPANCIGTMAIEEISQKPIAISVDIKRGADTIGRAIGNKGTQITIRGTYVGSGIADAAIQASRIPEIGDVVVLTDASDTSIAGNYAVTDAEKTKMVDNVAKVSVTIEKFKGNDITTPVGA